MIYALKIHWKLYVAEAICLGIFMASAAFFGTVLEYPNSVLHQWLPSSLFRQCLMGLAMGATAIGIIYSPLGRYSGAHMNPAVTLTFLGLGKIARYDAFFFVLFQCLGGMLAVWMMSASLGEAFRDEHVNYVITAPGKGGPVPAFIMEVLIAFVLMAMVLFMSNRPQTSRFTGLLAGGLVAIYVVVSGPVSGFSMNPARTLASAVPAGNYAYLWIYLTAPFMGMFAAAILYRRFGGITYCAKLHHVARYRCFFKCDYHEQQTENDL